MHTEASRDAASLRWANQNDLAFFVDVLSVKPPFMDEPLSSRDEGELGLLNGLEDEDAIPSSVTPQTDAPIALPQSVLFEACEQLPALQSACDQEWNTYDGKLQGPPPCPRKQLFPVLPVCAKLIKHWWGDPLNLKHCLAGLDVKDMAFLGMEPSIAMYLNPLSSVGQ